MGRIIESTPEPKETVQTSTSWDGKHVLEYHEKPWGKSTRHFYVLDGEKVKGVTTVNGAGYPKAEALIRWMVQQGIEEFVNKTKLQKGADIGTVLHTFAECYEKGTAFDEKLVDLSPYKAEIERVLGRFLAWRKGNQDKVIRMESIVASPSLRLGGKIDTLRERAGLGLVLSDYKTSKNIYMEQLLQVIGGYRRMFREWERVDIPYVEIVTFPKLAEDDMHVLLADENGWTKDGVRTEIPNLFKRCERQFVRNYGTYKFKEDVDSKLFVPSIKE